jgi:UDP-N-acetylglucosamine 2-epimerase (non-hydrolysing)
MANAKLVLTDSGGIQEEATILGVPCVHLRENTERPVTITRGTKVVVGTNKNRIVQESSKACAGNRRGMHSPNLCDGGASQRIVEILWKRFFDSEEYY